MQSVSFSQQQAKAPKRQTFKFKQFVSPVQDDFFYDDSLLFDKKNLFSTVNPPHKKIKTIYDKITISNKNDPLHPSSYRKYQPNKIRYEIKNKSTVQSDKSCHTTKKFNMDNYDLSRAEMMNTSLNSRSVYKEEQSNQKDRKKFFKSLLKKFTENVQEQNSVNYRQKINLFKKIFEYYKIRPEQKEHFSEIFKKIVEKQSCQMYPQSNISTKMKLESRRNNYSVSQKRSESPRQLKLKLKDKGLKTSQQRRTLLQRNNLSHMLTIGSKSNKQQSHQLKDSFISTTDKQAIQQLEMQLSTRKALNIKILQQDAKEILSAVSNPHNRTKVWDKKIQLNLHQLHKTETPIDVKLHKFRQFLFAVNFGNNLYVPLQVDRYQTTFKIYVGGGNNSNLIRALFKKRFWFQLTKNITEANLIWTQLKEESIFANQKHKSFILSQQAASQIQQQKQSEKNQILCDQNRQLLVANPETQQSFNDNVEQNGQNVQEFRINGQPNILDLKALRIKHKIQFSKILRIQCEARQPSHRVTEKSSNQGITEQNIIRLKKHPQLLLLKNIHHHNSHPLSKVLNQQQMAEYDNLYLKKLKDPFKSFGNNRASSFAQRKNDIQASPNGYLMKEQEKHKQVVHNHLQFNGILGNKKAMFYILREYCSLKGLDLFNIVPMTFHIKQGLKDEQYKKFAEQFQSRRKSKAINYWVMKPGEFSNRGNGIQCTNKLQQIRKRILGCAPKNDLKNNKRPVNLKSKSTILQSYITNPLLYNGRKFDIRTYMMTTVVNGKIKAYWYEEGYIRTSSYVWSLSEIEDREIHLTNDAVQKHSDTYGKYEQGNKLSYRDIQRYLEMFEKAGKNVLYEKILPQMKQIASLSLKASYLFLDPHKHQNNFQIFGFDFMLDSKLKPWLIQINTNPCLELGCPILERIIPNMLQNAFRITIDPLFPPPSCFSSNYKYNIAENAVNYNKFELIFDQAQEGPAIKKLYADKDLQEILTKIQDIQEDKQTFQEQGQQIDLIAHS